MMPLIHAERALELVGTRFKLQGRDRTGVDCLGVVVLVFDLPADALPDDYRLRGRGFGQAIDQAGAQCDRAVANPAFASETARRSQALLATYREQEEIMVARLSLAERRRLLREASGKKNAEEERAIALEEALIEDRPGG